jgi:hypothetical protein
VQQNLLVTVFQGTRPLLLWFVIGTV